MVRNGFFLEKLKKTTVVFHASTKIRNGRLVAAGGRVLAITTIGETLKVARIEAYREVKKINFNGMQYRKDIGKLEATAEGRINPLAEKARS